MSNPYGPPEPGEPPHPPYQQPYGQQPFGQQPYGQPGYPPYGQQPGYPPQPYGYPLARPDHPRAVTALVLGIVGLVGGFVCGLPLLVSPFAWAMGVRTRREIDAQPGLGGRGQATAGMVTGIIGTVLLVVVVLFLAFVIVLGATGHLEEGSSSPGGSNAAPQSVQPTSTGSLTSRIA